MEMRAHLKKNDWYKTSTSKHFRRIQPNPRLFCNPGLLAQGAADETTKRQDLVETSASLQCWLMRFQFS